MFDIQLFGRIEVRTRGVRLAGADFGGDRPRHLLALLALRGEASISELADLLGTGRRRWRATSASCASTWSQGCAARESVIVDAAWPSPARIRSGCASTWPVSTS